MPLRTEAAQPDVTPPGAVPLPLWRAAERALARARATGQPTLLRGALRAPASLRADHAFEHMLRAAVELNAPFTAWRGATGAATWLALDIAERVAFDDPGTTRRCAGAAHQLDAWRERLTEPDTSGLPLALAGFAFATAGTARPEGSAWSGWPQAALQLPSLLVAWTHERDPTALVTLSVSPLADLDELRDALAERAHRLEAWADRAASAAVTTRASDHHRQGNAGRGNAGRGNAGRGNAGRSDAGRSDTGHDDIGQGDSRPWTPDANGDRAHDRWRDLVTRARDGIMRRELDKVVVARSAELQVPPGSRLDLAASLLALHARTAGCTLFCVHDPKQGTFFGATPELLASLHGARLSTMALAGTAPRDPDPAADRALGEALLASDKDRHEHQLVRDAILDALRGLGGAPLIDPSPGLLSLSNVHHLCSRVELVLERPHALLDAVAALHPTPAVSGAPHAAARAWLEHHEDLDRGWYAGPLGWLSAHGDGEFVVALRSALLRDGVVHAFAGAGIVAASDPEREWDETRHKLRPIIESLRIRRQAP